MKNSPWLSDSSTCVAWNQSKFIDNWVRHAVMALWTWKMSVRGCDSSKKAERLVKTTRRSFGHPEDEPLKKRLLRPCSRGVSIVKNVYVYRVITLRNDCIFSFLWWVVFSKINNKLGDLRTWTPHVLLKQNCVGCIWGSTLPCQVMQHCNSEWQPSCRFINICEVLSERYVWWLNSRQFSFAVSCVIIWCLAATLSSSARSVTGDNKMLFQ